MSAVLSNDPLTRELSIIAQLTPKDRLDGPGYGTASQQGHVADWNSTEGIRAEAVEARFLTESESLALERALNYWPWLAEDNRKIVNRVVTMLFTIRKRFSFSDSDRTRLNDVPEFRPKPKPEVAPRQQWRRTFARQSRERGSFSSI